MRDRGRCLMRRPLIWLILLSLASGVAAFPALAREKARISELTLMVDEESVWVSFFVDNCFSPTIEKIIQSGVPANLTFFVKLHRTRALWKDKRLAFIEMTRRIHYDNIKKEYQVFMQETSPPVVIKDFLEAKDTVARVENMWVTPWKPLRAEKAYYVSVRAELEPIGVPFHLKNLLFFVPSGKTKTDWLVQKFRIGSFVVPKQTESAR